MRTYRVLMGMCVGASLANAACVALALVSPSVDVAAVNVVQAVGMAVLGGGLWLAREDFR